MGLLSTFIVGLENFSIIAVIGFVIIFLILWLCGRATYKTN